MDEEKKISTLEELPEDADKQAVLYLLGAIPIFKNFVNKTGAKSVRRVLNALMEYPMDSSFQPMGSREKQLYETGKEIITQKTLLFRSKTKEQDVKNDSNT